MKAVCYCICICLFFKCSNKLKSEIDRYLTENDFLSLALLCSELKPKEYESACKVGTEKAEEEILSILNNSKDIPFSRIHVEEVKRKKIEELFRKNAHLQIKYSNIWRESVYRN